MTQLFTVPGTIALTSSNARFILVTSQSKLNVPASELSVEFVRGLPGTDAADDLVEIIVYHRGSLICKVDGNTTFDTETGVGESFEGMESIHNWINGVLENA